MIMNNPKKTVAVTVVVLSVAVYCIVIVMKQIFIKPDIDSEDKKNQAQPNIDGEEDESNVA